jgi:hypothetical protein
MSNRERKQETRRGLRDAAQAARREAALTTPRHVADEFEYPGAGELLLRLAYRPSFELPIVWEVRSLGGALVAYVSRGLEADSELVVGHELIAVDDPALRAALDQLSFAALPLLPALTEGAVADGATYQATIEVGFRTHIQLSWCSDAAPAGWSSAVAALLGLRRLLEQPESAAPQAGSSPLCLASTTSTVKLMRLSTGGFHVWDPGELGSLICGPDHILATDTLAEALRAACGEDIQITPATISSKASGEVWTTYQEIRPVAELGGSADLPRARQSATTAWHHAGAHLFVSSQVQTALTALKLPDLAFSPGFSQFAGARQY